MTMPKDMPERMWVNEHWHGGPEQEKGDTEYIRADVADGWKKLDDKAKEGRKVVVFQYYKKNGYCAADVVWWDKEGEQFTDGTQSQPHWEPMHYMELPQPPKDEQDV